MSSDPGRKGTSGKGGGGGASGPAAARRRGLLVFGVGFLALFLIVAIAEGLGDPSIPSGDVALVEETPGDIGNISQEQFDHALELAAKQAGEKQAPKPGTEKYDQLKETALNGIFESVWLQGLAAEEGIEVSDKEIAKERRKVTQESFPSRKEFKKFLNESGFTNADVNERVKLQVLSTELQENLQEAAPTPTEGEVESYYEAAKETQFTQPPSRDVRLIVNKNRKKAKEAREALAKDSTVKNWKKVARKYSEDEATKAVGGLQEGVPEGTLEEPLDKAVFDAPERQVEGPLKAQRGFTVFEVVKSTPGSVQPLAEVESQIESALAQQLQQEYFNDFIGDFSSTWAARTFCASGFVTERCSGYRGDGHPTSAPAGCYEADPEAGEPEACPAPVLQLSPATPGSVTPLLPKGQPLAQRPRPQEEGEEEGAAGLEGLPPGITPAPEGAAPPEGE